MSLIFLPRYSFYIYIYIARYDISYSELSQARSCFHIREVGEIKRDLSNFLKKQNLKILTSGSIIDMRKNMRVIFEHQINNKDKKKYKFS